MASIPPQTGRAITVETVGAYTIASRSWDLRLSWNEHQAALQLRDPFSDEDEESLRWALEAYPLNEPFKKSRALNVQQKVEQYAQSIFEQLKDAINVVLPSIIPLSDLLTLLITADADGESLHRIHWECLEHLEHTRILIRRTIRTLQQPLPSPSAHVMRRKTRLLLFTARRVTANDEDVSYTLVSRVVHGIISSHPDSSNTTLHLVRPGTWHALEMALKEAVDSESEVIVHFDCHGSVSNGLLVIFQPVLKIHTD